MYSNWTDDLQRCKKSGVGTQNNQTYRLGGGRGEVTDYEDTSGSFNHPVDCFLYGVFDGHEGARVANFSLQRFPAEILLGQMGGKLIFFIFPSGDKCFLLNLILIQRGSE